MKSTWIVAGAALIVSARLAIVLPTFNDIPSLAFTSDDYASLRLPLFATFFTACSFLMTANAFILQRLKDDILGDPAFILEAARATLGKSPSPEYDFVGNLVSATGFAVSGLMTSAFLNLGLPITTKLGESWIGSGAGEFVHAVTVSSVLYACICFVWNLFILWLNIRDWAGRIVRFRAATLHSDAKKILEDRAKLNTVQEA